MNLLHLIATLDPAAGGTSEAVRALIEHLPPGYTAEVATLDDPAAPFLQNLPFKVHPLGPQQATFGYNKQLIPWLRANRHRFDGVFINGMWQFLGFAAMRALHRHTPYIVITHGMLDPWFKRTYPLKHLKKWAYWLPAEYWVLRRAHRVLFTTHEEARLAKQSFWLHRWSPHVAAIGAARPPATPTAQLTEAFFQKCPAAHGKRFVLFLGRIHVKKGCDMLIEAFAKVAAKDPTLHLVMAGPDQQGWSATLQQTAHEKGIGDRVLWPGMLKDDAKWGAFFATEVFILPSHQENFGIAVAEALACARPALLAAPVNIAPEVAEDGAGFVEADTTPEPKSSSSTGSPLPHPSANKWATAPAPALKSATTCKKMPKPSAASSNQETSPKSHVLCKCCRGLNGYQLSQNIFVEDSMTRSRASRGADKVNDK